MFANMYLAHDRLTPRLQSIARRPRGGFTIFSLRLGNLAT
jgi:hypothetical protein